MNAISYWNTNETLLQSYRSIFISSHSFLLTLGGVLYEKNSGLLIALGLIAITMIFGIWTPVVRTRHRIVDYYKFQIDLSDADREWIKNNCSADDYATKSELRSSVNEKKFRIKTNLRSTRLKLDVILPWTFAGMWAGLVALSVPKAFG